MKKNEGKEEKFEMKLVLKWWKIIAVFILLNIFLSLFYYYKIKPVAEKEHAYISIAASEEQIKSIDTLSNNSIIEQKIHGIRNEISSMSLMLRKSEEAKATDSIQINLIDETTGNKIQMWEFTSEMFGDYQIVYLPLNKKIQNAKDKEYILQVVTNDLGIMSPALTNYSSYSDGNITVGNQTSDNTSMIFQVNSSNDFLRVMYKYCFVIICCGYIVLSIFSKKT